MTTHLSAEVVAELRRLLADGRCLCSSSSTDRRVVEDLLDAAEAARETTPAEVGLREAVEAARIEMGGIGSHADPCRLPDTPCLCGVVSAREDARAILTALLAEHPAPAPEAEVAAGERAGCEFGCTTHDCTDDCNTDRDTSADVWNERTRHWYCPRGNDNCGAHATPPADDATPAPHVCDTGNFDRTLCPEPCGRMHSYCDTCGERQDPCAHDATPAPAEPKWYAAHGERVVAMEDICPDDPAEVDAGDVEALAWMFLSTDDTVDMRYCLHVAENIVASDWLAALLDRERRATGERIAQAIEAHLDDPRGRDTWTLRDTARIARADALGAAGEGTGGAG